MAHKTRFSNTSGLGASSHSYDGSENMFSGTSTSQWRKTEWHSQHPHSVSTVSTHCTRLQNTYTASTHPHKVPIQGTQDTYRTAHMCTVHMLPYTACIVLTCCMHSTHKACTPHTIHTGTHTNVSHILAPTLWTHSTNTLHPQQHKLHTVQCIHSTYMLHAQQPQKFIPPRAWIHEEKKDTIPGHFNHCPMSPRTPLSFVHLPLLCPSVFLTFGVWNSGHLLSVTIPFAVGMRECWPRDGYY